MDAGRYAAFEAYLHAFGLIDGTLPVADIAIDVTAQ
jgi:putative hydroxymethylpyrimidine transport system substrate-binding protein